jgi:hypothetical protein
MKVEIPFDPRRASGVSVRAMTSTTSLSCVPEVTHALVPLSTQWSPSRTA